MAARSTDARNKRTCPRGTRKEPAGSNSRTNDISRPFNANQSLANINCDRFSTLDRLLRVTAYVLKFVRNIKKRLCKEASVNKEEVSEFEYHNELNARALNQCEVLWIRAVQASAFTNEIIYLQRVHQTKPNRVDQFQLFLDEDKVLRCRGRINNASLQVVESKNPTLLPTSKSSLR